jgi:hypothetical protein
MRLIISIGAFIAAFVIGTFAASLFFAQSWQEVPALPLPPTNIPRLHRSTQISAETLRGTWTGPWDHDGSDCTITFDDVDGNRFTGTLTERGTVVRFGGTFDPDTRVFRFNETRVVELSPAMSWWSLGKNVGTLSADGRYLSGTGVDKRGQYYWQVSNY